MYEGLYTASLQAYSDANFKTTGSYSLRIEAETGSINSTAIHTLTASLDLTGFNTLDFDARSNRAGSNFAVLIEDVGGAINSQSINILTSGSWQHVQWDITGIPSASLDAIHKVGFKVLNDDINQKFWVDGTFIADSSSSYVTFKPGTVGITGSMEVSYGITGSLYGTASWAENAGVSASYALTASYAESTSGSNYFNFTEEMLLNTTSGSIQLRPQMTESVYTTATVTTIDPMEYTTEASAALAWSSSIDNVYSYGPNFLPLFDSAPIGALSISCDVLQSASHAADVIQ